MGGVHIADNHAVVPEALVRHHQFEGRLGESPDDALKAEVVAGRPAIVVHRLDPRLIGDVRPSIDDGLEQTALLAEVIADQRRVDAGRLGDVVDGDPVETRRREQGLGVVQDQFHRFPAPVGLRLSRRRGGCG